MLPSPQKTDKGWYVYIRPGGERGPRYRKTFHRKKDAEKFIFDEYSKYQNGIFPDRDMSHQRLSDLIKKWYELKGYTLKSGEKRLQNLEAICLRMGDPKVSAITPEFWMDYQRKRLNSKTRVGTPMKANAVNHEQAYVSAVFGTLIKLRVYEGLNPLSGVPKLDIDESAVTYLDFNEIRALLAACEQFASTDLHIRVRLCLATGARWGEVEKLQARHIRDCKIHFEKTKNANARAMPISEELSTAALEGRPRKGRIFDSTCLTAFSNALDRAGIDLPRGQNTHVLRHTFATHYMIDDGNILHLQKMLGHKTLAMTMMYAKFSPSYLQDALTKNPLAQIDRPVIGQTG